jgi:hypothetical protein
MLNGIHRGGRKGLLQQGISDEGERIRLISRIDSVVIPEERQSLP